VEVLHHGGGPVPPPRRGGGGPTPLLHRGGVVPWRTMTHAVEEEPAAMAPHHRRGFGGRRDAGAHGRPALRELQQQRPLESSSCQTVATLGELQQQLIVGELQQQRPFETLPAHHCFPEREKKGRREIERDIYSTP
jgi:hypothetical protein